MLEMNMENAVVASIAVLRISLDELLHIIIIGGEKVVSHWFLLLWENWKDMDFFFLVQMIIAQSIG